MIIAAALSLYILTLEFSALKLELMPIFIKCKHKHITTLLSMFPKYRCAPAADKSPLGMYFLSTVSLTCHPKCMNPLLSWLTSAELLTSAHELKPDMKMHLWSLHCVMSVWGFPLAAGEYYDTMRESRLAIHMSAWTHMNGAPSPQCGDKEQRQKEKERKGLKIFEIIRALRCRFSNLLYCFSL